MGVGYDDDIDQDRALEECPLDDGLRLVAKQELREDDVIRAHSLRAMRNWIRKHPDIVTCRTGNCVSATLPYSCNWSIKQKSCATALQNGYIVSESVGCRSVVSGRRSMVKIAQFHNVLSRVPSPYSALSIRLVRENSFLVITRMKKLKKRGFYGRFSRNN